jgi:DNA-binding transcriptional LysR family regulator
MTQPAVSGTDPATWRSSGRRSPQKDRFSQLVLVQEPRHVALRAAHPLAGRREIDFSELLDEAFLALPEDAGRPRDYWLAVEHRDGRPPRIGGIVTNAEETFEAVLAGLGVVLLSAGNAEIYQRPGVATVPYAASHPASLRCCGETRITAKPSGTSSPPLSGLCSWTSPPQSDRRRRRSRPLRRHQTTTSGLPHVARVGG